VRLRRRRREAEPSINLTPLIDVVFLLLIFFMVSTTFDRPTHLAIELPKASSEAPPEEAEPLVLVVDARGNYYLRRGQGPERRVVSRSVEALRRALREGAGEGERPALIIQADARTPHQAVVTAMDAARRAGFDRLAIAAVRGEGQGR